MIIKMPRDWDHFNAAIKSPEIAELCVTEDALELDMGETRSVDTDGVIALRSLARHADECDCDLWISDASACVQDALEYSDIDYLLPLDDDTSRHSRPDGKRVESILFILLCAAMVYYIFSVGA